MCGIFAIEKCLENKEEIHNSFIKTQHRGPDNSQILYWKDFCFGFHRLAINGLDVKGNQPFQIDNVILCCNGEIYNSKELIKQYNLTTIGNSDCEVILHLYKKFGILKTISVLSGYFAFLLYDKEKEEYFVGRDPFGVRSLFYGHNNDGHYLWSSEMKSLLGLCNNKTICSFPSGHLWSSVSRSFTKWYDYSFVPRLLENKRVYFDKLYELMEKSVQKRFQLERPFGVFLSGGLDSSIIAALVSKLSGTKIHTFSIGLEGSEDLKYARIMANHIQSHHHEVIVSEREMLESLPRVIYATETYDITTIRASCPMFLLSEYIKKNTDIVVVFSGEGSDELSGSYLYFHKSPSPQDFHNETIRLLKDLQYFDCLRCDKATSSWGLEVRCPFLDKEFVQEYMTLPIEWKLPHQGMEKWFLRMTMNRDNLLPDTILWRQKEAFSDGVSSQQNSWFNILTEFSSNYFQKHGISSKTFDHNPPLTQESQYYREVFDQYYPNCDQVIPYYWMPKWNENINDPSARHLEMYKKIEESI